MNLPSARLHAKRSRGHVVTRRVRDRTRSRYARNWVISVTTTAYLVVTVWVHLDGKHRATAESRGWSSRGQLGYAQARSYISHKHCPWRNIDIRPSSLIFSTVPYLDAASAAVVRPPSTVRFIASTAE